MMHVTRFSLCSASICLLLSGLGCSERSPSESTIRKLNIQVSGRLERGSILALALEDASGAPAVGHPLWISRPAGAIARVGADSIRLLVAGPVEIEASGDAISARVDVVVAVPPTIVFDLAQRDGSRDIYRVDLDGSSLTRLTNSPSDDISPSSADGRVIFVSYRDGEGDLYSVPLSGGGSERRLTHSVVAETSPTLSTDGSRLAYVSFVSGVARIWIASGDATSASPVSDVLASSNTVYASPSWSPTGDRLAFVSTTNGNAHIFTIAPTGGVAEELAVSAGADLDPAWSPNGRFVAFASDRNDESRTNLFIVDVNTGLVRQVSNSSERQGEPAWLPDGRLVFTTWIGNASQLRWLDPDSPEVLHEIDVGVGMPRHPKGVMSGS